MQHSLLCSTPRRSGELALFYAAARAADIGITPKALLPLIAQLNVVIGILIGGVRIGLAAAIGFLHRALIGGIRFGARLAAAWMIAFDIDAKTVLVACLCQGNRRFRRLGEPAPAEPPVLGTGQCWALVADNSAPARPVGRCKQQRPAGR